MKTLLITGGAGFIGQALARKLCGQYRVVIFDDFHRGPVASLEMLPNVSVISGDITDYAAVRDATRFSDIVIHAAAIAGVSTVIAKPYKTLNVNLIGTHNVLQAIAACGLRTDHLIMFSTSEVYGPLSYKAAEESMTIQGPASKPRWVYGVSKLAAEHLTLGFGKEYDVPVTVVRPFNVYGPGQIGDGAIHNFVTSALCNEPLVIHGDGTQIRSWCYIDDFVDGFCKILENPKTFGEVFNLGNPRATCSTLQLVYEIRDIGYSSSPIEFMETGYPEIDVRIPNIEKAQSVLDFYPTMDLNTGLRYTFTAYRKLSCVSS